LAVIASFVVRFSDRFDPSSLAAKQRLSAAAEIDGLIRLFNGQSAELETALANLRTRLRTAPDNLAIAAVRPRSGHRALALLLRLLPPLAVATAVASTTIATPAYASITVPAVGASIVNPNTNTTETVVSIIGSPGYAVQTSGNNILLLATAVNDTFTDSNGKVQTVTAISTVTYGSGGSAVTYTTGLTLKDSSNVVTSVNVVTPLGTANTPGGDGSGSTPVTFPTAAGDINQITQVFYGNDGSNGHAGFEVCVLGFCVGYGPSSGGNGATGPTVTLDVPLSH
jgi:hypothetical protein